jgi:hypothetical protein
LLELGKTDSHRNHQTSKASSAAATPITRNKSRVRRFARAVIQAS